jgi:hypothetical protein
MGAAEYFRITGYRLLGVQETFGDGYRDRRVIPIYCGGGNLKIALAPDRSISGSLQDRSQGALSFVWLTLPNSSRRRSSPLGSNIPSIQPGVPSMFLYLCSVPLCESAWAGRERPFAEAAQKTHRPISRRTRPPLSKCVAAPALTKRGRLYDC